MMTRTLTLPELGLIAATRAFLGAGIGLLVADHLNKDQRRAAGWTLVGIGVLTTFPLAANVLFGKTSPNKSDQQQPAESDETVPAPS